MCIQKVGHVPYINYLCNTNNIEKSPRNNEPRVFGKVKDDSLATLTRTSKIANTHFMAE